MMSSSICCRAASPRFIAAILVSALASFAQGAPELRNAHLEIAFDPNHGALVRFIDRATEFSIIDTAHDSSWWSLQTSHPDAPHLTPAGAAQFLWSHDGDTVRLEWKGFPEYPVAQVSATVTLPAVAREARWHLEVDGLGEYRVLEARFPQVNAIAVQEDEVLAVPVWMGEMAHNPREVVTQRREWEWPGILSLQCLALYAERGPGILLSADDTSSYRKRFAVTRNENALGLEIVHLPETTSDSSGTYTMPYQCILGTFSGDWFTVAERYRAWPWIRERAQGSRLTQGLTPAWVREAGLWVWNRGRSENVLRPAAELQHAAGLPVNVFWHWWHGCAYDIGFPEYLPPREGTESFKAAMATAHDAGLHAIVYMNQRLWGMTTQSWESEDAARFAVKGPDGTIRPEIYNTFTKSPCAAMCMGTDFWRNTYAGLATEAHQDLGVDGIYMDQACATLSCYDPAHGHPIGGGTYWLDGFRHLSETIRANNPGIGLAGEGCGEAWLPYLDMMLSLQVSRERYSGPDRWQPIPFFQAVYGGHALFFGNYSSLTMPPYDELWPEEFAPAEPVVLLDRKFATQFRLEQARAYVWGQQPTLANFRPEHLDTRAEELHFVFTLARLRNEHLAYLQYGTMLRPPELDAPAIHTPMSRLSIYAGQREGLREFEADYPPVLASAWQAHDRSIAIVLVNISDDPQTTTLDLDREHYPLPTEGHLVHSGNATIAIAPIENDHLRATLHLAPHEAAIYHVTSSNRPPAAGHAVSP